MSVDRPGTQVVPGRSRSEFKDYAGIVREILGSWSRSSSTRVSALLLLYQWSLTGGILRLEYDSREAGGEVDHS